MVFKLILFVFSLQSVSAICSNACSGHGECREKDNCSCYRNWRGADCSLRSCPFGLSFVTTPQGNLNHDNYGAQSGAYSDVEWSNEAEFERWPARAHEYMECSNAGLCDRLTGLCDCFEGYEGSSCQRTTCPNRCSGHGVCRTVGEIARGGLNRRFVHERSPGFKFFEGVTSPFDYRLWDADKHQACVCDDGYTGPDCSSRECPFGDDNLLYWECGGQRCRDEKQVFVLVGFTHSFEFFSIVFTDLNGKKWRTRDMIFCKPGRWSVYSSSSQIARTIEDAMKDLPNDVVHNIRVNVAVSGTPPALTFTITFYFVSNPGDIPDIEILADNLWREKRETPSLDGTKEVTMCSSRGICDFETGVCTCFLGFYGGACEEQSALAI